MKNPAVLVVMVVLSLSLHAQKRATWVASSPTELWARQKDLAAIKSSTNADAIIELHQPQQII